MGHQERTVMDIIKNNKENAVEADLEPLTCSQITLFQKFVNALNSFVI
jgi:hypothetical protein